MNDKQLKSIGKFLSLILRHRPETIHIHLDENGWTDVEILIQQMNKFHKPITFEELKYLVENNNKKRYSFNEDKTKIRANQGHSVNVDLNLNAVTPPDLLYHGTADKYLSNILEEGLKKKQRHHVHLSLDIETATNVGRRHGKLVIFEVDATRMHKDGLQFFKSDNDVWLTDEVPVGYLKKVK
ncbi:RNA 2'-phosphotransferase [Flammeovirga aprica]|uniref:Probable RNA 2'-phosphotransferase n=1 Tax=Flammeovirga aprica JL-4 TaxID=694437 RepID=A0A7X9S1B3_9BACT|nr:RNA 2'-phosphotransferase [Flammeovirga aprica]NME72585.1 RNA 2'-phosphotransferase [Flammeovirga aprica JL-4]